MTDSTRQHLIRYPNARTSTVISCSLSGCIGNAHYSAGGSKGYCRSHYLRHLQHGDPTGGRTPRGELLRWVREVALKHVGDECLTWPYTKGSNGYGKIRVNGKELCASRYVCILVHGDPPTPQHEAAHSCGKGNEGCTTPNHLSWKTPAENQADRVKHGTHRRGERNKGAKLTEEAVREIIALKGVEPLRKLAVRFGVSTWTVEDIHRGRNWAWLTKAHSAIDEAETSA